MRDSGKGRCCRNWNHQSRRRQTWCRQGRCQCHQSGKERLRVRHGATAAANPSPPPLPAPPPLSGRGRPLVEARMGPPRETPVSRMRPGRNQRCPAPWGAPTAWLLLPLGPMLDGVVRWRWRRRLAAGLARAEEEIRAAQRRGDGRATERWKAAARALERLARRLVGTHHRRPQARARPRARR